ncbi:MAG: hypothetical protein DRR08_03045 [Candidatus Parabeggiatoa sp. nov. 2]|nr:MAG: hypothetical protein B6247_09105 [Beggiatoa sp. 4572_84]RKZ63562.1 MAG: hypothetical protein DRR08_03045 [Gammaproteobacteria bacterium]
MALYRSPIHANLEIRFLQEIRFLFNSQIPAKTAKLFDSTPGVEAVRLDLNGTVTVTGGANAFTGIIDYTVEIGNTPTGGLQLNESTKNPMS